MKNIPYLLFFVLFLYTPFSTEAVVENRFAAKAESTNVLRSEQVVLDSSVMPIPNQRHIPKKQEMPFLIFDNGCLGMILAPFTAFVLIILFTIAFPSLKLPFSRFLMWVISAILVIGPLFILRLLIRGGYADKVITKKEKETLSQKRYRSLSNIYTIWGALLVLLSKLSYGLIFFLVAVGIAQFGVQLAILEQNAKTKEKIEIVTLKPTGKAGKYGYLDKSGQLAIPYQYQMTNVFNEGLAHVKLNNKWGYIDKNNSKIIDFKYDEAKPFSQGLAVVQQNGKYGYINKEGKVLIPFEYDDANSFVEEKAEVWKNGQKEILDFPEPVSPEEVAPTPAAPPTSTIRNPMLSKKELRLVERAGKYGFEDGEGNILIAPQYNIAYDFKDGLAQVQLNNQWGFIDKKGTVICEIQYSDCNAFSEGLAVVQKNGKYGYINNQGKIVIPLQFDTATDFKDGKASVGQNGNTFWINQKGRKL